MRDYRRPHACTHACKGVFELTAHSPWHVSAQCTTIENVVGACVMVFFKLYDHFNAMQGLGRVA